MRLAVGAVADDHPFRIDLSFVGDVATQAIAIDFHWGLPNEAALLLADQDGGAACTGLLGMERTGRKGADLPRLVGHGAVLGDQGELSAKHQGKSGKVVGVHVVDRVRFEFERLGLAVALFLELLPELRFVHVHPLRCLAQTPTVVPSTEGPGSGVIRLFALVRNAEVDATANIDAHRRLDFR